MLGFEQSSENVSDEQLSGAEQLLGVKFPVEYREEVQNFGGSFGDVAFLVDRPSEGFDRCSIGLLLSLLPQSRNSIYRVMAAWEEHELSARLIPIAEDGGGNYLCLDYRNGDEPDVVFYFHELSGDDGIIFVCSTFAEFLTRLVETQDHAED